MVEAGHPHCNTCFDLEQDEGSFRIVRDAVGDLHSAIHWTGVHDNRSGGSPCKPLLGQSEPLQEFAGGISQVLFQPFPLNPEHHHDVGARDRLVNGQGWSIVG